MKKVVVVLVVVVLLSIVTLTLSFSSSGKGEKADEGKNRNIIMLGVNGTDFKVWDYVEAELEKEGIDLEVITFSDYIQPNLALAQGGIDINSFQTQIYFDQFKQDHNLDLVSIGNTVIAPMGVYSEKYLNIAEIGEKAKIAIPNDATNGGRALILLQEIGVITLKEGVGVIPTEKDIVDNPKQVEIVAMSAQQIPVSLKDVDLGIINSGVAVTAGLKLENAIYRENIKSENSKNYYNIFAVKKEDENNKILKRLVEIYQTEPVKKILEELYEGGQIPLF